MQIPRKKLKNGFEIPVLGLGTWLIGGDKFRDPNNNDNEQILGIKNAIEAGVTHIDTAENYAEGWAERLIGQAIKNLNRKNLFITSKVDKSHLGYNALIKACSNSLNRLGTDYLDLYLIHAPNDEFPLNETMKAMDRLVEDGLVKNIGVSNFKTTRLIEAQKNTKNKIVTDQVYYNVKVRYPEKDGLLKYCQENDIILTAYRPTDNGALLENPADIIHSLAKKYNKSPVQIMLNWLIAQKNVVVLCKMIKIEHLKENLGAVGWQMDSTDVEMLRKDYPNQSGTTGYLSLL